ncbi:MAG TPA: RnfABCDGE type electron transport complex subunit D [Firmicutes bacterium]|nr:RnfABCDGE type electron transport complex subunit D [Candidatus Fermentithermobacillaceae bacterium]
MGEKLIVTPSPHIKSPRTVKGVMLGVVISLLPACVGAVVLFGMNALLILITSVVSAVVAEALWQRATKQEITVGDFSAVITGLLLAMTLPPGVPLYVPAVGSVFAIVIAKQIFGGLGSNFVNPALAGRAFVLAAWPMSVAGAWLNPLTHDAVSSPTPLAVLKGGGTNIPGLWDLLIGNRTGSLGETSIILLLLGGLFLLVTKIIDWRTPVGFLGTLFVGTWIFGKPGALFQGDGLSAILLGGAVLGAFFMATDYVTSPVTPKGRLIFGIGAGLVTLLIRLWGGYPEGVTYGILFMNLMTPIIDRFVVPKYYGYEHDARARKSAEGKR